MFLGHPQLYPNKKPLEETIQTALKGQNNYMNALLLLMSEDAALTPLGSDKEEVHACVCMYVCMYVYRHFLSTDLTTVTISVCMCVCMYIISQAILPSLIVSMCMYV